MIGLAHLKSPQPFLFLIYWYEDKIHLLRNHWLRIQVWIIQTAPLLLHLLLLHHFAYFLRLVQRTSPRFYHLLLQLRNKVLFVLMGFVQIINNIVMLLRTNRFSFIQSQYLRGLFQNFLNRKLTNSYYCGNLLLLKYDLEHRLPLHIYEAPRYNSPDHLL